MTIFRSTAPFGGKPVQAAAVYCSDGRIDEQVDEFLTRGLGIAACDRVVLPGGPASLAGSTEAYVPQDDVADELNFLIEAHELKRLVLIQHQPCGFYHARFADREDEIESLQQLDLLRAAQRMRQTTNLESIEAYYARLVDNSLIFEPVGLG